VPPWASLQSLPGTVDHGPCSDREQGTDRGVDAPRGAGDEAWAVGLDAYLGARSVARSAHGLDRALVRGLTVVGEGECLESLANGESAIEIAAGEAAPRIDQTALGQPIAQRLGADQLLRSAFDREIPACVHEGLHERQLAARGLSSTWLGARHVLTGHRSLHVIIVPLVDATNGGNNAGIRPGADWETPVVEIDVRVGRELRNVMRNP
jgi:hypothetical protein